ncbi:hypothetical protein M0805_003416 [Coniferiporia weirii]|nr:hypothetical protein M0805_003416 [Coniferiporia weirii]
MFAGLAELDHISRLDNHDYHNYVEQWWEANSDSTSPPTHTQERCSGASYNPPNLMNVVSMTPTLSPSALHIPIPDETTTAAGQSFGAFDTTSRPLNTVNSIPTLSIPHSIMTSSITFMTLIPTTVTTPDVFLISRTSLPRAILISAEIQATCLGDGLDTPAVGVIATVVLPSIIGLAIWLVFSVIRPHLRQVYNVREWFCPQDLRPQPLKDTLWAFLFPQIPFIPPVPDRSDITNAGAGKNIPSDGQLSQRVLCISFLVVLGWSVVGLAGVLPLYLVDTPCLAQSSRATFGGIYSVLQDLSLLRLLQLLEEESSATAAIISRATANGGDVSPNIRARFIVLTVFTLVFGIFPALYKLMMEFSKLVEYRKNWLEIRCGNMEIGWLSAKNAPGFVGWGEKRVKDFIVKTGLSSSLDRSGGIGTGGSMAGIGSGYRARTQSQQNRSRDVRALSDDEKAALQVDIAGIFSIGDTGELPMLIAERDSILENLEMAEARYIASFRLTTPDPSIAELPMPPADEDDIRTHISRPRALAGSNHARSQRRRQKASSSSTAPTSYVAPSQYYKLRNVRGISGGRILSQSGEESSNGDDPSFADSVRSRIVGSRFQEFSREHTGERLPIGSRIALHRGELTPVLDTPVPVYGPNHGMEPSSGNEADTETLPFAESVEPGTSRGVSGIEEYAANVIRSPSSSYFAADKEYSGPSDLGVEGNEDYGGRRRVQPQYPTERRETFPMRYRGEEMQNEAQVPLHLRLQPQGPFVRPLSGLDHDGLGSVYSNIQEWRTKLKQINGEISDAQNDCYGDIADGARIKGWLVTGRGLRFLPGMELIEGRSKDDIMWKELQHRKKIVSYISLRTFVVMVAIMLGAGLIAVAGLVTATAPNVAYYLAFFRPLLNDGDDLGLGIATIFVPVILATLFFIVAVEAVQYAAHYSGSISVSSAKFSAFKASFFILTVVGVMWFTAAGAVIFAIGAFAVGSERVTTVANGAIYMSIFFLALVANVTVISPGLLLLQPARLKALLRHEKRAVTPRQRFRALYPGVYDPTYAMGCCILAVVLASTFSFIFPLIGPAVAILLFLTIVAHRFLVSHVYGRTDAPTGGLMQIWLLKQFATVATLQPILLGLIFMARRLFIEGGVLAGCGFIAAIAVELYTHWKTKLPGRKTLSAVTLNAIDRFRERALPGNQSASDSEGTSLVSVPRVRQRGSMASVLEMMSLNLAVIPTPHETRGAVPLETESLDDLAATERAARTNPDAPPHLPLLPFADHAEEMAGILYAPELIAPLPVIWLPNDSAGIARSEAYDLQRYHNLRAALDVRSYDDIPRRSSSRRRALL